MGQIFRRLKNIAFSFTDTSDMQNSSFSQNSDDELKKIIEELNSENFHNNQNASESEAKSNSNNMDLIEAVSILDIDVSFSNDEIKAAYKKKIKEYHPDRLENFGEELKELARKKTSEINVAYDLIRKDRGF